MTRCPASCWSVRFPGVAGAVDVAGGGVVGGFVVVLGAGVVVVGDVVGDGVVGVEVVVGGVVVVVVALPFAAGFDPPLEQAPLSRPTAAISVTAATPPVLLRRPLRIPASTMDSSLAKTGPGRQPTGLFQRVGT